VNKRLALPAVRLAVAICLLCPHYTQAQDVAARTITDLGDGLFRVQQGDQVTVFLVTSEGIIVVDPMNRAMAAWLKEEFGKRFPQTPVRYVVHTSHDVMRASGNTAFAPPAEIVAHERFNEQRQKAGKGLPPSLQTLDANGDHMLQEREFAGTPVEAFLRAQDLNEDGVLPLDEINGSISIANRTFRRRETIVLGGQIVMLWSTPVSGATDMTVVVFPRQRIAFAHDLFPIRAVPARIGPQRASTIVSSMRIVEDLSFDTLLTGRGETATTADVTAFREYVEELTTGVRAGFAAGRTLTEVQNGLSLDRYKQWQNFAAYRRDNIADVYRMFHREQFDFTVAWNRALSSAPACASQPPCTITGDASTGVMSGVRYTLGRITAGSQLRFRAAEAVHQVRFYGYTPGIFQQRNTVLAAPVGYVVSARPRLSVVAEAGPAWVFSRQRATVFQFLGTPRDEKIMKWSWLAGSTVRTDVAGRVGIVAPIYLVHEAVDSMLSRPWRLEVSAGISVSVSRGVR
jgi:glyoxylase-like metal-dependent hydrolase (beta-lactamase superfamily II)